MIFFMGLMLSTNSLSRVGKFEPLDLLLYILFIGFVIFFSFYGTKLIARIYISNAGSKNIKIIERCNITAEKSIVLVQLADEYFFIYTDKGCVEVISKPSSEKLIMQKVPANKAGVFSLSFFKQKTVNKFDTMLNTAVDDYKEKSENN